MEEDSTDQLLLPRPTYASSAECKKRKLCEAMRKGEPAPCTNPAETCMRHCGGFCRSTGYPCPRPPVAGRKRCRTHGGRTAIGAASGTFKSGKFSRYLPKNLAKKYNEAVHDQQLLSLRDEIALLQVRIGELVQRLHSGESGSLWSRLKVSFAGLRSAMASGSAADTKLAIEELENTIQAGASDEEKWRELVGAIDDKRRIAVVEHRRLVELQQTITAEKALALFIGVAQIIRERVADRAILSAISNDMNRLIGGPVIVKGKVKDIPHGSAPTAESGSESDDQSSPGGVDVHPSGPTLPGGADQQPGA